MQDRNVSGFNNILQEHNGKSIIVGTHGTALSTIINYYDNSFGFNSFKEIVKVMPWVVKLTFNNKTCMKIEKFDLFNQ